MRILEIAGDGATLQLSPGGCVCLTKALQLAEGADRLQHAGNEPLHDILETLGSMIGACSGLIASAGWIDRANEAEWHAELEALGLIDAAARF